MREITNFVNNYLHLTRHIESPTRYLKWGAYSLLSAALRDNVWFSHPYRNVKLFPNIYVIILSQESANTRKSNPLDINLALLRSVGETPITKIIAGDATMQGILKTLANTGTNVPKGGSGYMVCQELKASLILDEMSVSYLTNIYNYHEEYDKHIISYEIPKIKGLCFSMLGATNEVMAQRILDVEAKEGGLVGRSFIIYETKRRLMDSGFEDHGDYPEDADWTPMKQYLRRLQTIKNCPMYWTEGARKLYNEWYHEFKPEDCHSKTGYEGRMGDAVQKMSIILSANEPAFFEPSAGPKKLINENILNEAIEECTSLIPTYTQLTMGIGVDPDAKPIHLILREFNKARDFSLSRIALIGSLYGNVSPRKTDELMYEMCQAGNAKVITVNGLPGWKLTEEFVSKLKIKRTPPNARSNGASG
jgi:hypothetical protein